VGFEKAGVFRLCLITSTLKRVLDV